MARRRMINNSIIESPGFYKLTKGAQSLYFHLCTTADDDGFSDRIGMIRRTMNLRKECVSELEKAGFIYSFSPDVALIVHWRSHNLIRGDRAFPSIYKEYRTRVFLRHDGCYVVMPEGLSEEEMSERAARERLKPIASLLVYENTNYGGIDKNREEKEKNKIILETELEPEPEAESELEPEPESEPEADQTNRPPAREEVLLFFRDNGYPDGELFFDCMEKNDWVIPGEKEPGGDWLLYAKHWALTRIKAYRKGFGG